MVVEMLPDVGGVVTDEVAPFLRRGEPKGDLPRGDNRLRSADIKRIMPDRRLGGELAATLGYDFAKRVSQMAACIESRRSPVK